MKCTRVQDNLMAYISQELPQEETGRIRQHLARCQSCRQELQSASAASEALSLLECEEETPELIGQIRSRLAHRQLPRNRVAGLRIAAAFSVAFLLVTVCADWLLREPNKPPVVPMVQRRQLDTKQVPRHVAAQRKSHEMVPEITTSKMLSHPPSSQPIKCPVDEKPVMLAQLPPEVMRTPEKFHRNSSSAGLPHLNSEQQLGIREGERRRHYSYNRDWHYGNFIVLPPPQAEADLQLKYLWGETVQAVQPQMLKELQTAKLGQIALFISSVSGGKSRLLIGQGASATPEGFVCRPIDSGDLPFVSAYHVSTPVKTELKPLKDCIILGAVRLVVPAVSPEAPGNQLKPGVYLIAYTGKSSDEEKETGTITLIDVSVDGDGKPLLDEVLTVPAERHTRRADVIYSGRDWHGVSVQFKGDVAGRVTVTMALNEPDGRYRSYNFQIDLQVIIL